MFQALKEQGQEDKGKGKGKEKGKGKSGDELKRWEEYQDVRREIYRHFEEGALKGKGKGKAHITLNPNQINSNQFKTSKSKLQQLHTNSN